MHVDVVRRRGYVALGSRMIRIGEQLRAETQKLMNVEGVPIQAHQYPLMAALAENGPLAIGDLAAVLGVSQPGVTRSVVQLSEQGFVTQKGVPRDKRVKIVDLTSDGRAIVEEGMKLIWPRIEKRLSKVMEQQRGDLLSQLDHLENAMAAGPLFLKPVESPDG